MLRVAMVSCGAVGDNAIFTGDTAYRPIYKSAVRKRKGLVQEFDPVFSCNPREISRRTT
jgi:hypothetical protein